MEDKVFTLAWVHPSSRNADYRNVDLLGVTKYFSKVIIPSNQLKKLKSALHFEEKIKEPFPSS
jgi:hypothetical protein